MGECLPPSAEQAFDNFGPTQKKEIISSCNYQNNFTEYEKGVIDGYFQQARQDTINDVNAIIGEFHGKEEDLLKYLRQKKSGNLSYDDKIQLSNLELALMKSKSQVSQQTQNNLQIEKDNFYEDLLIQRVGIYAISGNIITNKIVLDGTSRADLGFVKFDVPKFKKTKANIQLNTILEQSIGNGKVKLIFGNGNNHNNTEVKFNYDETSTHINFYYDSNQNGHFDFRESKIAQSFLKKRMFSQHDSYYYSININLGKLGIAGIKGGNVQLRIKKTD